MYPKEGEPRQASFADAFKKEEVQGAFIKYLFPEGCDSPKVEIDEASLKTLFAENSKGRNANDGKTLGADGKPIDAFIASGVNDLGGNTPKTSGARTSKNLNLNGDNLTSRNIDGLNGAVPGHNEAVPGHSGAVSGHNGAVDGHNGATGGLSGSGRNQNGNLHGNPNGNLNGGNGVSRGSADLSGAIVGTPKSGPGREYLTAAIEAQAKIGNPTSANPGNTDLLNANDRQSKLGPGREINLTAGKSGSPGPSVNSGAPGRTVNSGAPGSQTHSVSPGSIANSGTPGSVVKSGAPGSPANTISPSIAISGVTGSGLAAHAGRGKSNLDAANPINGLLKSGALVSKTVPFRNAEGTCSDTCCDDNRPQVLMSRMTPGSCCKGVAKIVIPLEMEKLGKIATSEILDITNEINNAEMLQKLLKLVEKYQL